MVSERTIPLYRKIVAACAVCLCLSVPAFAEDGQPYISLTGTLNFLEDMPLRSQSGSLNTVLRAQDAELETDTGMGFNHAIGFRFDSGIRGELEFSYRQMDTLQGISPTVGNTVVIGDVNVKSVLANISYDFDSDWFFKPYVGYGMGLAWQEAELEKFDGTLSGLTKASDSTFAYQLFFGVSAPVFDATELIMGYRYFGTNDPDFSDFTTEIGIHGFEFGLRHYF